MQNRKIAEKDLDRFVAKVDFTDDGCWEWTGTKSRGYGMFHHGDTMHGAHRWVYEASCESLPKDLWIDHLCRNRACVNPDHLEPVTPSENTQRGLTDRLRTHCVNGHPRTEDSYFLTTQGRKSCLLCYYEWLERRKEERRNAK